MINYYLPQTDKQTDPALQSAPNPRQRILVVEDDPAIRQVNTEVLTYSGYQVDAAEDGQAAWDALQLENYDLMVTDNDMPRLTGVKLIQELQAARMPLPVIMATGGAPDELSTRYGSLQPAMVLIKPYTFDELLNAVKAVLSASHEERAETAPPPNWSTPALMNRSNL